nr:cystathionine beta-synthase [Candidatus Freyarchaeota archaeon]
MKYLNNILEAVGNTPLVKLNKVTEGIEATVLAKLEMFNPGGSVKDRIGISMIEAAEKQGLIEPGYVIVEPTGGNTGIGLALAAVAKGYKIIFTIPDKMSREKIDLLKAFGAEVIVTPTAVPPDHPSNYVKVAERIVKETPKAFMPNQYFNPANPEAHYKTTGEEIWEQTDGKVDVLVASMGTGGTITGTAKYLKEKNPNVRVIGVDPEGSMIHHEFYGTTGEIHTYKVEGIGEDFMPSTLDLKLIDEIIVVSDRDAFLTARRLAKEEGIFAGGSSGAAVFAALQVAKNLKKGQTLAVILPDTGRNYMSKIFSDEWMREYGFLESVEEKILVADILKHKSKRIKTVVSVKPEDTLETAVGLLRKYDISQLPVVADGVQVGSVSEISVMRKLASKEVSREQKIGDVMDNPLQTVNITDKILNPLSLLKDKNAFLVLDNNKIVDIIATIDVINYFVEREAIK